MSIHGNNSMRKLRQQGGTLLGLIIGLIIGLAIAVIVALAITKTSLPFTNKNGAQPAVEPAAGQITDPNKPLYGNKAAAKEAAKDFVKEPETAAPVQIQPEAKVISPAPKSEPKPEVKADSKLDNKAPVVEKSTAEKPAAEKPKAAEAAAKTDAVDDKFTYFLQAGAFREQTDAESAKAKLALLGVEARISERASDNGTLYRVRVGPFGQLETMNRMRSKLSENGVDVAVVRSPK